ncbi:Hypp2571 [Branchiostoma lanceolatum]|uniref:Hypp2571 protein n=1 Tax=Branchiostoma lanceolatum TaxID=7740 RepID=A0A8J9ZSN4_BRALA|nr:Hypp2571 [Branchiostoma lanceolatum]
MRVKGDDVATTAYAYVSKRQVKVDSRSVYANVCVYAKKQNPKHEPQIRENANGHGKCINANKHRKGILVHQDPSAPRYIARRNSASDVTWSGRVLVNEDEKRQSVKKYTTFSTEQPARSLETKSENIAST